MYISFFLCTRMTVLQKCSTKLLGFPKAQTHHASSPPFQQNIKTLSRQTLIYGLQSLQLKIQDNAKV
jgi:hypothetical protein